MEQAKCATGGLELEFFKQMAVSPAAFEAYLGLGGGLSKSSLSQELQEELSISVSDSKCWARLRSLAPRPICSATAECSESQ
jgi:hypothetical protein